jgi:hypothetical protein
MSNVTNTRWEQWMETKFGNDREAHELLDLINTEFQTDPHSTACFDKTIVERVRYAVALRKKLEKILMI